MSTPNFALQAEAIVFSNDQAHLHARLAALEWQQEHGEYPPEFQIDRWAEEFQEEHERAVNELTQVLKSDYEFHALTDSFSEEEYDEDEGELTIDQYCEICHDAPDGCDACLDS